MAGRPAPAAAHAGARTKHPRGSRGGAGPGRTGRGFRRAPGTVSTGGVGPSAGSGTATKWRPPLAAAPLRPRAGGLLGTHPPRDSSPSGHIGAARPPCPLRPPPGCSRTPAHKMADTAPHTTRTLRAPPQRRGSRRRNRSRAGRDCGPGPAPPSLLSAASGAPRGPRPADLSPRVSAASRGATRRAPARSSAHLRPRRSATAQWGRTKALRAFIALRHPPDGAPDAAAAPSPVGGARDPPPGAGARLPPRPRDNGARMGRGPRGGESRPAGRGERAEGRGRRAAGKQREWAVGKEG